MFSEEYYLFIFPCFLAFHAVVFLLVYSFITSAPGKNKKVSSSDVVLYLTKSEFEKLESESNSDKAVQDFLHEQGLFIPSDSRIEIVVCFSTPSIDKQNRLSTKEKLNRIRDENDRRIETLKTQVGTES